MGYATYFEMETMGNNGKYKISDIIAFMQKKNNEHDNYYPFKYLFEDFCEDESCSDFSFDREDSWNWYRHENEMLKLSIEFPEIVFCLHGEGERNEDIWYKYFKNGKMQYCPAIITFDEYDEKKLK